jgi:hypothetical protein
VVVHAFGNGPEAEMAKSALEAAGINVMIQADTAGGMSPHLVWASGGFKVLGMRGGREGRATCLDRRTKLVKTTGRVMATELLRSVPAQPDRKGIYTSLSALRSTLA